MGDKVKTWFELRTTCSDTIISYQLLQELKFLGNGEFNHYFNKNHGVTIGHVD